MVALHGSGSNTIAFHDLWKSTTDMLGFVLLTPQGESKTSEGFGWDWGVNAGSSVLISIDIVRESVNVDPRRIYVTGFSSGGSLAYYLGLRYSDLFGGLAALSAGFDEENLPTNKIIINKLRAYIGHGSLEQKIADESKFAATRLKDRGIEVKYVQYEGIGHTLPDPMELELRHILNYLNAD